MKNIVYQEISWEQKRNDIKRKSETAKYNPRTKDINFALEMEFIGIMNALECGMQEPASQHLEYAKKYADKMNKDGRFKGIESEHNIEDIFTYYLVLYYLSWFEGNIEKYTDVLIDCLEKEYMDLIKDKRKIFREGVQKSNVSLSARLGKFELAKRKIERYANVKNRTIEQGTGYDFYQFYLIVIEYLLGMGTNAKEDINNMFLEVFSEHRKGSREMFFAYGGMVGIYDVYYLYYKFFLNLPGEEVTAEHVFRSCENGILYWKKERE